MKVFRIRYLLIAGLTVVMATGGVLLGEQPARSAWEGPQSRRPAPSPSVLVPLPVMLKLCRDHLLAMNKTLNEMELVAAEARKSPDRATKERALARLEASLPDLHRHMVECLALIEAEQGRQASPKPSPH